MKTNLVALMNLISEYEKSYSTISYNIKNHIFSTSTQELNGTINIIEDYQDTFSEELIEMENISNKISKLKGILYEKNNQFKLSDGRSIQTAIVENNNLRKLKSTYEVILTYKNSKNRVTEVNNSYFEVRQINYNEADLKAKVKLIDAQILNTDYEISKLNSQEFEIDI